MTNNPHTITAKLSALLHKHGSGVPNEPLSKATYVELFFDLTFIFCMRSILPIITDVEGGSVDWYSSYTFRFTFALMLQIWFNSTIYMNRFGTSGVRNIIFLFTTMFLLSVMTRAISTGWERRQPWTPEGSATWRIRRRATLPPW